LRYTLDRTKPEHAWFYATLKSTQDYLINVDPNAELGVTKVWINVLLRDGDKVLGVIGTVWICPGLSAMWRTSISPASPICLWIRMAQYRYIAM